MCMFALLALSGCKKDEIVITEYKIKYETDGNGAITGEATQTVVEGKDCSAVTAIPNAGYRFVEWSDGITTPERQDKNITSDKNITAIFEKLFYSITYTSSGNGFIRGKTEQSVSYGENGSIVTAVPKKGYRFVEWSDGYKFESRYEKNVMQEIHLEAVFDVQVFTVEFTTDGNGYIEGESVQKVEYGGNTTTIKAVANEGYEFDYWTDGYDGVVRQDFDVKNNYLSIARFKKIVYNVTYNSVGGGGVVYLTDYKEFVDYGSDGSKVVAEPQHGFVFLKWSDGCLEAERQELDVRNNIELTAYFGYSVEYKIDENNGGSLTGKTYQTALAEENYEKVTAVPDAGYVFAGWSDLKLECSRIDKAERCFEYVAYFEPIEKTFKYVYGNLLSEPLESSITLNRNKLSDVRFFVPEIEGYAFCGWYTDNNYTTKIADENGYLMLGYYTFDLDTESIYAKWKNNNEEEKLTHKILLVMVDEVHANRYSKVTKNYIQVDYKMTCIERKLLSLVQIEFSKYLNEWFDGYVNFEVDIYFTTEPTNDDNFNIRGGVSNWIFPNNITEINRYLCKYHNLISAFGLNDHDRLLLDATGLASMKYGAVSIDGDLYCQLLNHVPLQNYYTDILNGNYTDNFYIDTYVHEYIHTVEACWRWNEIFEFHQAIGKKGANINTYKMYLLGELEIDGELVGIPAEYWSHEKEVDVNYVENVIDGRHAGKIIVVGTENKHDYVSIEVPYGSDLVVQAIPYEGYRFLKWSDGVETATRHDVNIISYLNVIAIFEKDDC